MSYHISAAGARLEDEVDKLRLAIGDLRVAGTAQVGHETLNEIGQAINRVGCVLINIKAVTPTLKADDAEVIQRMVERMGQLPHHAPDNYRILVERAVNYYVIRLQVHLAELLNPKNATEA